MMVLEFVLTMLQIPARTHNLVSITSLLFRYRTAISTPKSCAHKHRVSGCLITVEEDGGYGVGR